MSDDFDLDLDDLTRRMEGAINALRQEFASLRTGRASATMLDPVMVDAYGSMTPLNQIGTVNVPEPRKSWRKLPGNMRSLQKSRSETSARTVWIRSKKRSQTAISPRMTKSSMGSTSARPASDRRAQTRPQLRS